MGMSDEEGFSEEEKKERDLAAAKIQALHRGKKGKKKANATKEKKEKDDHRKKHNPKIGETQDETTGLLSLEGGAKAGIEIGTKVAERSTETLLKMFGQDGGAYLRTGDQRQCRDLPMCVSFGIYWLCMLFLANYGWTNGDIDALFYPVNYEGTACGVKDYAEYKALYYPWIMVPEMNTCMKGTPADDYAQLCPGEGTPAISDMEAPFKTFICHADVERKGRFAKGTCAMCHYDEPGDNYRAEVCGEMCIIPNDPTMCQPKQCAAGMGMEEQGPCWHPYGATRNVLYQCVPVELAKNASDILMEEVSAQIGSQHFLDMKEFGWVIGVCCGIALVASFTWILFLDHFAGPLIWCTVYAVVIILPCIGLTVLWKAGTISVPVDVLPEVQERMGDVETSKQIAYSIGMGCFIGDAVLIAIFCIFKERITIAIGVIEEASDCFLDIPTAVITPFFTFMVQLPVCIWGIVSTLLIVSLREFDHKNEVWVYSEELQRMVFFNVCGCLWALYTFASIQYTTVAGACADWYFTFSDDDGDRDIQHFAVPKSFYRVIRFNMGSMIFGGLLITIVVVLKWVATYCIQQVMAQSPENKIVKFLGTCLICMVNCVEKLIRFLGKLAFIEVSIYGVNFCTGVYSAAKRLISNIIRFSFLAVFAHLMIFLGKIGVTAGSTYICFVIMSMGRDPEMDYAVPVVPLFFCCVVAFLTVTLIMQVYEIAVDTIMMCFLEDEAENTGDKPSFATGELAQFMTSTKKISDAAHEYNDTVRGAKGDKIKSDDAAQGELMETHEGVAQANSGLKGSAGAKNRSAKSRRAAKKDANSQSTTTNPMDSE
jgi:hypothetical protein